MRAKVLAAFLAGILFTLGVLMFRDRVQPVVPEPGLQLAPLSEPEPSHKGELSQPQRWRV